MHPVTFSDGAQNERVNSFLQISRAIPSTYLEAGLFLERLKEVAIDLKLGTADMIAILVSTEEALVNAMAHGNRHEASKSVEVDIRINRAECFITIADQGEGLAHDANSSCATQGPRHGLDLMREFMDVSFSEKGNVVTLERRLNRAVAMLDEPFIGSA